MYPKFKSNLMALAVALGVLAAGYGFGAPPSQPVSTLPDPVLAALGEAADEATLGANASASEEALRAGTLRRGALQRHMAMPYVSMASLMPRRES
ncbi:hypothetical protein K3217_05950 [bacterium BD-1]|uniref:hypothetical protein n=1 Tax=Arenimonas sp. TaxID=1872635 RepID=UPI001E452B88|nr:hypothetical protein [Ottowia caeni]